MLKVTAPAKKAKAFLKADISDADESEDAEYASEKELEYDDTRSLADSDSSGSEFVLSDSEVEFVPEEDDDEMDTTGVAITEDEEDDDKIQEDDDEIMLDAAIHMSLQTRSSTNGASGSSKASQNSVAARAAAAAERRLAANRSIDVDDSMLTEGESDSEPIAKKSKGKGKANRKTKPSKKKVAVHVASKTMTLAEMKKTRRDATANLRAERKEAKKLQLELRRKLGRKLTMVRHPH